MQAELWSCVEGPELDVSMNGEILSMLHIRNRLISSHSDGTIKVLLISIVTAAMQFLLVLT